MSKSANVYLLKWVVWSSLCLVLLSACSDEKSSPQPDGSKQGESDPELVRLASAVALQKITLYQGHVDIDDIGNRPIAPVEFSSGALITVEAEYQLAQGMAEYVLSFQIVPEPIFEQLNSGSTLGEVLGGSLDDTPGLEVVDLGSSNTSGNDQNIRRAVLHTKLPVLNEDQSYKVSVTPSLEFISSGNDISNKDFKVIPVLFSDDAFTIRKFDQVEIKIASIPNITESNEFTQLEISEDFGNGDYSTEPIFKTSVEIDLSTFDETEDVVLSIDWHAEDGQIFPLGLFVPDGEQKSIGELAQFTIERGESASASVPVVVYVSRNAHQLMSKIATPIRKIADEPVKSGSFVLKVGQLSEGIVFDSGVDYELSLPLVSQDHRPVFTEIERAIGYRVLRAGPLKNACLQIPPNAVDIDTGELAVGSTTNVIAESCDNSTSRELLWRYDSHSMQFISKLQDSNGDNYCLTAVASPVVTRMTSRSSSPPAGFFDDVKLEKCEFRVSTIGDFSPPGTGIYVQSFFLEGEKIALSFNDMYLTVADINSTKRDVVLIRGDELAATIVRNLNGAEIDSEGRVFYVGDEFTIGIGSSDRFRTSLSVEGETYVDYMPVIGATTNGDARLGLDMFDFPIDIVRASFSHQRYLPKKIPGIGNSPQPVEVGNGAEFFVDLFGQRVLDRGNIVTSTVTESFNPLQNYLEVLTDPIPEVNLTAGLGEATIDEQFIDTTFFVIILPVTLSGGVKGSLAFDSKFNTEGLGAELEVTQHVDFSGYLEASLNTVVTKIGLQGLVKVIEEDLTFSSIAAFKASGTSLGIGINANLEAKLKLLKGEVTGFAEYREVCFCSSGFKVIRKEKEFYSSDYLFSDSWKVYEELGLEVNLIQ